MDKDLFIKIGDYEITNYTSMKLSRHKNIMSGVLELVLFDDPKAPSIVLNLLMQRENVNVYIAGNLAFTGNLTNVKISGKGKRTNATAVSIAQKPNEISLRIQGRTNILNTSSHLIKDGVFTKTNTRDIINSILKSYNIPLIWDAKIFDLNFYKLTSGGYVYDEIARLCSAYSYFCYESFNGCVHVSDKLGEKRGIDLILGVNILAFESAIDLSAEKSHVVVRGHINNRHDWGRKAILQDTSVVIQNPQVNQYSVVNVLLHGDVTKETLMRRARFEMIQRNYMSQVLFIDVFGLSKNEEGYDLGKIHHVNIPTLGVDEDMECIEINYIANASGQLITKLTLSSLPVEHIQKSENFIEKNNVEYKIPTDIFFKKYDNDTCDKLTGELNPINNKDNVDSIKNTYFYKKNCLQWLLYGLPHLITDVEKYDKEYKDVFQKTDLNSNNIPSSKLEDF